MNILYTSKRVGQYGKLFTVYKLRTMIENADKMGGSSTADDDKRITKTGKILRKTKLDKLPQLINLLKGDMVLIGWRPESPEYLDTIPEEILKTKPGITGLATLNDFNEGKELRGKEDPDQYYKDVILPKKRELELYYVRNKTFKLKCWILWRTIKKLLTKHD